MAHDQLYDSQLVKLLAANVVADSVSPVANRALYNAHAIQFVSAGAGTLLVEGTINNIDWVIVEATQAANSILQVVGCFQSIRVTRDNTTDEVSVWLGGYDANVS